MVAAVVATVLALAVGAYFLRRGDHALLQGSFETEVKLLAGVTQAADGNPCVRILRGEVEYKPPVSPIDGNWEHRCYVLFGPKDGEAARVGRYEALKEELGNTTLLVRPDPTDDPSKHTYSMVWDVVDTNAKVTVERHGPPGHIEVHLRVVVPLPAPSGHGGAPSKHPPVPAPNVLRFATGAATAGSAVNPVADTTARAKVGVISYWERASYDTLPAGSVATINPQCGIVAVENDEATIDAYRAILAAARQRGVTLLGYVRTGYGKREAGGFACTETQRPQAMTEIERQIDAYFAAYPDIPGVFFDETSYAGVACTTIKTEWSALRARVKAHQPSALIAWNPGTVGDGFCYLDAAETGEIVAVFEQAVSAYLGPQKAPWLDADLIGAQKRAHARGVSTWHLVHSAEKPEDMEAVIRSARGFGADYVYVTDRLDWTLRVNTWGAPPKYWERQKNYLLGFALCAEPGGRCDFRGMAEVRYGAGNTYVERTFTGGVSCDPTSFGTTGIAGAACYRRE